MRYHPPTLFPSSSPKSTLGPASTATRILPAPILPQIDGPLWAQAQEARILSRVVFDEHHLKQSALFTVTVEGWIRRVADLRRQVSKEPLICTWAICNAHHMLILIKSGGEKGHGHACGSLVQPALGQPQGISVFRVPATLNAVVTS